MHLFLRVSAFSWPARCHPGDLEITIGTPGDALPKHGVAQFVDAVDGGRGQGKCGHGVDRLE
jgi:hypothetical protein